MKFAIISRVTLIPTRKFFMKKEVISKSCFALGLGSVIASIVIWVVMKDPDPAHGERFGIFVGLWAPTFFSISNYMKNK